MKKANGGMHRRCRSGRSEELHEDARTNEHGCRGEKGYYLLTSSAEVPTRGIQRRVVGTRHTTLQQPGK